MSVNLKTAKSLRLTIPPSLLLGADVEPPTPKTSAYAPPPHLPWQHPWLTVQLLLRSILHEHWTNEQWKEIRKEIPALLKERERIRKAGWFN
jgi:hypothetical protein